MLPVRAPEIRCRRVDRRSNRMRAADNMHSTPPGSRSTPAVSPAARMPAHSREPLRDHDEASAGTGCRSIHGRASTPLAQARPRSMSRGRRCPEVRSSPDQGSAEIPEPASGTAAPSRVRPTCRNCPDPAPPSASNTSGRRQGCIRFGASRPSTGSGRDHGSIRYSPPPARRAVPGQAHGAKQCLSPPMRVTIPLRDPPEDKFNSHYTPVSS